MSDREFEYRLNRLEAAGKAECPADAGYAQARRDVFGYVESSRKQIRELEAKLVEGRRQRRTLLTALVKCAIPLETLRLAEMDGRALCDDLKASIMAATECARDAATKCAPDVLEEVDE